MFIETAPFFYVCPVYSITDTCNRLFSEEFSPALRPTRSAIHWVAVSLFPELKQRGREAKYLKLDQRLIMRGAINTFFYTSSHLDV